MYNYQIKKVFQNTDIIKTPLTEKIIKAGYQQKKGGFIDYALSKGIKSPTQFWHLMYSWSKRTDNNAKFTRTIQCGELIFWMAEVLKAVDYNTLNKLSDDIINYYIDNRKEGNRIIQQICFDKLKNKVTFLYNHSI